MLTPHDRVLKAICHEEPDRVPISEPYGIHPPTADIVLGRECIATSPIRQVMMHAEGRISEVRSALVNDNYELVKKLGFDMAPIILIPREDTPGPRIIGARSWAEGDSVFRLEQGGIPVLVPRI